MTFSVFISRLFSAFIGGMIGSFFLFIVHFFNTTLASEQKLIPEFFIILSIFVGIISANSCTGVFLHFFQPQKYNRKRDSLTQVFYINMFLFVLSFPLYSLFPHLIPSLGVLHIIFSVFVSNTIYELYSGNGTYSLSGIYGSMFGGFLLFFLLPFIELTPWYSFIHFWLLPASWIFFTITTLIVEYFYSLLYSLFGVAFLNPNHNLDDNETDILS